MALHSNQSFAELLRQTTKDAPRPEDVQEHTALLTALSLEIARLRTLHDRSDSTWSKTRRVDSSLPALP
jgi:hypothetical protein